MSAEPGSARPPIFRKWTEYRRDVRLIGSEPSHERLVYPQIPGSSFGGNLEVAPPGRGSEEVTGTADKVFLVVEGEADFQADGAWYSLVKLDMISIPAGHTFRYLNGGLESLILCEIAAFDGHAERPEGFGVEHWAWKDYRRDFRWTLPWAETPGYHRGSGPLLRPPQLRGHTVRFPANQSAPWHHAARDLLFLVVDGEIEFECGGGVFAMDKLDFLLIPALMPYKYTNFGLTEEIHLSIGGMLEPGKKGVYYESDPGWPVRPDAKTIPVAIDIYGDAKVDL